MKKIISLFQRDYKGDRLVRDEVVPGAEWVQAGEGLATIKWDGTSCMVCDGVLYKRYDLPLLSYWKGQKKNDNYAGPWHVDMYVVPPLAWEPAQAAPDQTSGHWPGWLPVGVGPEDKWHREAVAPDGPANCGLPDGTYELIGPKVQGNPHKCDHHMLIRHGIDSIAAPRTFEALKAYLQPLTIEGVVWHHPDGRMVKIKRKDFWK